VEIDIAPAAIAKILGTVAALMLLAGIWQILVWIVISLMFVATFNPLVRRMQSHVQRPWAITALVTLCVGSFGLLLALVIPPLLRQGESTAARLPEYLTQVEATAARMHLHVNMHAAAAHWSSRAGAHVLDYSLLLVNSLLGIFTVFVLTIYLLVEGPQVATSLTSLLPRGDRLHVRRMFGEIGVQVGAYMRGQLITSSLAGLFAFIILFALKVPEPLALAFLMMLADLVPIVGPLLGTVPALLMALTQGVPVAVEVLVGYIIYLQVEANFISPRVYGSALKLSPFVVLVALLIGGALMGMLGAMLALPVAAAIPIVVRYVTEWRERSEAEAAPPALP
jgi:predicted PurR-regulated permease PerM